MSSIANSHLSGSISGHSLNPNATTTSLTGSISNSSFTGNIVNAALGGAIQAVTGIVSVIASFLDLTDTPDSYSGQAGKVPVVKTSEDGLEFSIISLSDEKIKVSSNDTTAGYAENKFVAGTGITLSTLGEGTNESLSISLYASPTVSLSGGSTNEMGTTVSSVSLVWDVNKLMTTRVLSAPVPLADRDQGSGGDGNYDHTTANLTTATTYTITVGDGTNTAVGSTNVYFYNRIYYGSTTVASSYSESDVEGLASNVLSNTKGRTISVTANTGYYIIYALPTRLGTVTFWVGGFEGGFQSPETVSVTNASGFTENYYVYRSTNSGLGATSVVVV